jgi:glucose-6-phosphate 1-dehydrogenase
MQHKQPLAPTLIFIFGGSGDLNYRKLTPALYNLFLDESMPQKFHIVGVARTEYDETAYKQHLLDGIVNFSRRKDEDRKWIEFSSHISYVQMDAADEKAYYTIADIVKQKEQEFGGKPILIFSEFLHRTMPR